MSSDITSIEAVILDVDGTLVESNDAHAAAFVEAMNEHACRATFDHVRRLIGMGSDRLLPEAVGVEKNSARGKRITGRKKEILAQRYLPHLRPCRGARALVAELKHRGMPLIVASSASQDELHDLLKAAEVDDLIEQHTSSDDAEESKPAPDIVQAALEQLEVEPRRALMIGDTPYDVEAALKAGVPIIAVRCGGWEDEDLQGALAVYDDPSDVLVHLDRHVTSHGPADRSALKSPRIGR